MGKKLKRREKGEDAPPLAKLAKSSDPKAARMLHGNILPGAIYSNACRQRLAGFFGDVDVSASGITYADDLIERMAPRDPAEEMLVVQMLMAHARVMHLTSLANGQERLEPLRIVNEYADRASNTYRRLMLALAEYRKPPRGGDSFTAISQANIAGQQVVMNGETSPSENATNEQGHHTRAEPNEVPAALPAESRGAGIAPVVGTSRQAVGAVYRAENARGQGPKSDERLAAR